MLRLVQMPVFDEKKLVYKLDRILKKEFGTNLAFYEFSAGYGIADLVFAPEFLFRKSLTKRAPLTNFTTIQIFLSLETKRTYHFKELCRIFPDLGNLEIKKQIRILTNNQYLEKVDSNLYRKVFNGEEDMNPIKKVVAIEVKLNDHKNGLIQARRYQYFADESYLAILKEAEKNINLAEFNKYNIGLILFDTRANSVEIRYPHSRNGNYEGAVNLFAKEMMLSSYLNFSF